MTQEPLVDVWLKLIIVNIINNYESMVLKYKLNQTQKTGKFKRSFNEAMFLHGAYNI